MALAAAQVVLPSSAADGVPHALTAVSWSDLLITGNAIAADEGNTTCAAAKAIVAENRSSDCKEPSWPLS